MLPLAVGVAAVGALSGGASASMDASNKRKQLKAYIKQQKAIQGEIRGVEGKRTGEINQTYDPLTGSFVQNANDYFGDLKNVDYTKYNVDSPDQFNFDMAQATQDELNPDIEAIINRSTGAVQQSAANRGGLFSGATAKGIARSTADIQAAEWDKARGRAQETRTNKYQEFIDTFNNAIKVKDFNRGNETANLDAKGTLFTGQGNLFGQQQQQVQGVQNAADTAYFQSRGEQAGAASQKAGTPGFWSSFAQGALGGLSGSAGGAVSAYGVK